MLMVDVFFLKFVIFIVIFMQDNNLECVVDWIFSYVYEFDFMEEESFVNQEIGFQYNDGLGSKYQYKIGLFVL